MFMARQPGPGDPISESELLPLWELVEPLSAEELMALLDLFIGGVLASDTGQMSFASFLGLGRCFASLAWTRGSELGESANTLESKITRKLLTEPVQFIEGRELKNRILSNLVAVAPAPELIRRNQMAKEEIAQAQAHLAESKIYEHREHYEVIIERNTKRCIALEQLLEAVSETNDGET